MTGNETPAKKHFMISEGPKRGSLKSAGKRQESATFLQRSFFNFAMPFFVRSLAEMKTALQTSDCCSATSAAQPSENCSATSVFSSGMLQGWGLEEWGLGLADHCRKRSVVVCTVKTTMESTNSARGRWRGDNKRRSIIKDTMNHSSGGRRARRNHKDDYIGNIDITTSSSVMFALKARMSSQTCRNPRGIKIEGVCSLGSVPHSASPPHML